MNSWFAISELPPIYEVKDINKTLRYLVEVKNITDKKLWKQN